MRRFFGKALALVAAGIAVALVAPATPATAHGEAAQESFLRMGTVAFWDVSYTLEDGTVIESGSGEDVEIKQNEAVTIKGTAKILETFPNQLGSGEPDEGFVGIVVPGPVVVVKEKKINGLVAPHAIELQKGDVFNYEIKVVGRTVGRFHLHSIFGVHKAGSLVGPGQYFDIKAADGGFVNTAKLDNGDTINLEKIGVGGLWFWTIVSFLIGFWWLLYWIVPKPTVTRLPVTLQIPLNTDGQVYGLISKKDHRQMNVIMGVTLLLTVGSMFYYAQAYPNTIVHQVLRQPVPEAELAPSFANVTATGAEYDVPDRRVDLTLEVENTGDTPVTVTEFTTSLYTWTVEDGTLELEGGEIAPGATGEVTLKIKDERWKSERMMPLAESRIQVTGVARLNNGTADNFATVQSLVRPSQTKY
jgi:methane/ammonia monooxygenase subunit B